MINNILAQIRKVTWSALFRWSIDLSRLQKGWEKFTWPPTLENLNFYFGFLFLISREGWFSIEIEVEQYKNRSNFHHLFVFFQNIFSCIMSYDCSMSFSMKVGLKCLWILYGKTKPCKNFSILKNFLRILRKIVVS